MNKKSLLFNLIIAGMTLGTAWAIRGQFGHEQGAAWAGAIGGLSIILLAKRSDWYNKIFKATMAVAIGWGLGGMMSYGKIVGYGRGIDFVNVYYGLVMLFVIGALHGIMGGGLFGLVLSENEEKKIKWHKLLIEMTVGGMVFYYFFVAQLGWKMTPPRSEAWGVCAGIAIAILFFIVRNKRYNALRVAVFAGLGGGFGFAFGNFLQVIGNVLEIPFNFWNVMEYSLGFFGGAGMAYGVFSSEWSAKTTRPEKKSMLLPIAFVSVLIPFIVWQQSFITKDLEPTFSKLVEGDVSILMAVVQVIALLAFAVPAAVWLRRHYFNLSDDLVQYSGKDAFNFFMGFFGIYIVYTFLITGSFMSFYRIEQYLYLVNYAIIGYFIMKVQPEFISKGTHTYRWLGYLLIILAIIAVLALIAINTHGEMPGMQIRFE